MTVPFTRTPSGLVGTSFFYPKPIVWVEGPSDIFFYEPILGERCTLKPFHGISNAKPLIERLRAGTGTYPFAIIIDGDYDILEDAQVDHRWIVQLKRHSFENYLWEQSPLNKACLRHAQCGEDQDVLGSRLETLAESVCNTLRPLIVLDIASRRLNPAPKVLPDRAEPLLVAADAPDICPKKVKQQLDKICDLIPDDLKREAEQKLRAYEVRQSLIHILKGHILLGVLLRLFFTAAAALRGAKCVVSEDAAIQLLSEMVWRLPSDDHKRLRRKLRTIVTQMRKSQA